MYIYVTRVFCIERHSVDRAKEWLECTTNTRQCRATCRKRFCVECKFSSVTADNFYSLRKTSRTPVLVWLLLLYLSCCSFFLFSVAKSAPAVVHVHAWTACHSVQRLSAGNVVELERLIHHSRFHTLLKVGVNIVLRYRLQ